FDGRPVVAMWIHRVGICISGAVPRELYILSGKRRTVVPLDTGSQVECDRRAVRRDLPRFGQRAGQLARAVEADEPLVKVVEQDGRDRGSGIGCRVQRGWLLGETDNCPGFRRPAGGCGSGRRRRWRGGRGGGWFGCSG